MTKINYKAAGVDIDAANEAVKRIKASAERTFSPQVLTGIGSFGALYDLKPLLESYQHPVLVQSIDGVGTKMIVARMMQQFDTLGIDLVSATTNDILVLGAKPLTLLDYIASDQLNPDHIEALIVGMTQACLEHQISLVGGETAEMPGTYLPGEQDLVGVITGVVEKEKAILGQNILPGDLVLAFPSSGLHTNGYSLARNLLFERAGYGVDTKLADLDQSLGETLLKPHINYARPVLHLLEQGVPIKGMAHITGGGVLENIPRILPPQCAVRLSKNKCPVLPIFHVLRRLSQLEDSELYRTFNMGIGYVLILDPKWVDTIQNLLKPYPEFPLYEIGQVISGTPSVSLDS